MDIKKVHIIITFFIFIFYAHKSDCQSTNFINYLNQYRIENGLNPVSYCNNLNKLSNYHNNYLYDINNNDSINLNDFVVIIKHSEFKKYENVSIIFLNDSIIDIDYYHFYRWKKSKDHNENMLNPNIKYIGYSHKTLNLDNIINTVVFKSGRTVNYNKKITLNISTLILE